MFGAGSDVTEQMGPYRALNKVMKNSYNSKCYTLWNCGAGREPRTQPVPPPHFADEETEDQVR